MRKAHAAKPSRQATARQARQDAVTAAHKDLSTDELAARLHALETLASLHEGARTQAMRTVQDTTRTINELSSDTATLRALIQGRR